MSENPASAPDPTDLESTFVFHGRRLREGVELAHTTRFGADLWPLAPVALQGQERGLTLRFDTVPARHRQALKRLCYTALSGPLPPGEIRPSIITIATYFYSIRLFLRWLEEETGGCDLDQVSSEVLERYQRFLIDRYRSSSRRHHLRSAVVLLWRYRHSQGHDRLRLDPRSVNGWSEPYQAAPGENSTARIPEEIHSRLLVWALRFVNDFSDDILTTVRRCGELQRRPSGTEEQKAYGHHQTQIRDYLQTALRGGQPLPGYDGQPNFYAIARTIGCDRRALEPHRARIAAVVEVLGVSDYAYLDVTIGGQIDGQPWLEGVSIDPSRDDSITVLTQMLQAACYIVIAFLSGMRDSEVKHLRGGCSSVQRDGNGAPYRWTVSSLAFKGETEDAGVPATWVVGESAARAIDVLERVHRHRAHDRTDWLFAPIKASPGAASARRGDNEAMTLAGTNRQLNRFVKWVYDYCAARGRDDGIPDVDRSPWRVTTRQFRRTLAWYIARRPGGAIAGAIAYRHHSIQMFEGYAGTSESGFRAEVEAEEALARGEHLLGMIDRHEHQNLAGPASGQAELRLNELGERMGFAGTVTTDRHRLLRLMTRHDPAVYPGTYSTCVYDHSKALCRTRTGALNDAPDLTDCKPLTCRNIALNTDNLAAWYAELGTIDADLSARPTLPPLIVERLKKRREQIRDFLNRHEDPK